ncbi:MAG TPA: GNAT family N-acetyltransferase [Symbiobacteriaceae bacterium]
MRYEYRPARSSDLTGVARVFAAAFPQSVAHYFAQSPPPDVVAEPFALCLAAEPEGFFVAEAGRGEIAGYIFAPARTSKLKRVAVSEGFALRWFWRWVTGRFGIGLAPVRAIVANKLDFWASDREDPELQAEARILSVAVHPEHQGRGLAKRLCSMGLERLDRIGAKPVRLEVRPENTPALAVYTRLGFEAVGRARDAQGDWLIMMRHKDGPPQVHS